MFTLTATWRDAYYSIGFNVLGGRYCDVLIDDTVNMVVYPDHDPEILVDEKKFSGWSVAEGSYLPGDEGDEGDEDDEGIVIDAIVADVDEQSFKVVF